MEVEFLEEGLSYIRENELSVFYKNRSLTHRFQADFTVYDKIVFEVKSCDEGINNSAISQTLNYLKASGYRIGLIINFGKSKKEYRRLIM